MRIAERDGGERRDWGRFWVRRSKFSEHRTWNFQHRSTQCGVFALALLLVALRGAVAFGSSGQISEPPTEAVRSTLTEVFRILEDEKLKDPAKRIPRRHMLEEVIASHFDYTEMSKRALAANWTPLTAVERTEFVELFKSFLSDRYAEKIEGYSGEQVHYLSERIEGNYAEVRTELRSSKVEIPMDYRLHMRDGTWHAYDIIVDGVSLVKNYRSQFDKIIRSDSYQELVRRLRERTVGEDKKKKTALTVGPHGLAT
jgi:phospholipid transport system substrate-binding protein